MYIKWVLNMQIILKQKPIQFFINIVLNHKKEKLQNKTMSEWQNNKQDIYTSMLIEVISSNITNKIHSFLLH